jgi:hypothetical protein
VSEETAAILKVRRDNLPEIAQSFYRHLAGEVDIQATHESEVIEAMRLAEGLLEISIFVTANGEKSVSPYYYRIFDPEDTQDVRLFLNGGDDRVTVSGEGSNKIRLRIISKVGQNTMTDTSREKGTRVYDSRTKGGINAKGANIDRKPYTPPKPSLFSLPPRNWGNKRLPTGLIDLNGDIGLLLGFGLSRERYGFRRNPYASRWSASFSYATKLDNFRIIAAYDITRENSKMHTSVDFMISGMESLNFYGYGNETPAPEDDHYADVNRRVINLKPALSFSLTPNWDLQLGIFLEYSLTDDNSDTIAGIVKPYGTGEFWQAGALTELIYNTLDSQVWPTRGTYIRIKADYYPEVLDIEEGAYGSLEGLIGGVYPLSKRFSLAGRIAGMKVWGHYPYFQAAYVGGGKILRGFPTQRFSGDSSVYANLELRVPISRFFVFLPGEWGVYGFVDTGRVFYEGETSDKWHAGYGGGIWIAPLIRQFTMSLAVAGSDVVVALVFFTLVSFMLADTLILKDGQVLQGIYRGGDAESVFFEVEGELQTIPLFEISTITFSPRERAEEQVLPEQQLTGVVTVPSGSRILVNLTETVSTASHKAGASFSGVLATGLAVNGQVVVPPGTKIHGKVLESRGGRVVGGSRLVMTFTDLEINSQLVPIVTDQIGAEAGRGGTIKQVGAGALVGAAFGGRSGAGKGAAVGGALAILGSRRNHIQIPPDYQVEISLKQPLTLK